MNSIFKVVLISILMLAAYGMASAQTGAWIEHTFTPFGTGPQRYACGETVASFTYTNSNIILFFDINTHRWLEVDLQSTQNFHDLIAQGDMVFAFSDSFIIAYNGRNGSCSIRRYEGTPLNIDGNGTYERSYACGDKMAMFITDSFMYIFDIELDVWQVFDYSMPANYEGSGFYWINDDYAVGALNCVSGTPPTNIVYSLQAHDFNETTNGVSNYYGVITFKMDNGFAGMYTTEISKYIIGYSAAENQFSSITVNTDYTLESSSLSSYSYADEYTVYAAKSRFLITPHEDVRIEFYCYDTRQGNWTTMVFHADPDIQSDPMSWSVGGRQATCFTAWNTEDNLRRIYVYSGYTGEIQAFNPGIFYTNDHISLVGENSFLISDTSQIWAHNAETGQSSFQDIHKDWNRNYMGGKNFLTFTRRDTQGDSSNTYIYFAPDNSWRVIYNTERTLNNTIMGSCNGFVYRTYGDTPKMILYSAVQDEIMLVPFPGASSLGLYVNQNIIVGNGGETKLFDLRTAELFSLGTNFGSTGLGDNAAISDDINTNTLYGYSALTGNVTELHTNETPHVFKAINYVGLSYVSSLLMDFYMFNSFHDCWVELDLTGNFVQGGVGGKTGLLYINDAVYAFDPEATLIDIGDEYSDVPLPMTFSLAQNYPNPFNASTIIKYNLSNTSDITIDVFNILGSKVETIFEKNQTAGKHQVLWNAENIPSGVYFYRIKAGDYSETRKMVLLR